MKDRIDRRTALQMIGAVALLPGAARAAPLAKPTLEKWVPVEGGRAYARMNGTLSAERLPILFIHGGPGSGHSGFMNALRLADERAVILYDQLDAGRSDAPNDPKNWRIERFLGEIDSVRAAFGLERVHVYGGSWGGTLALEYAARRPRGLASTILQSPLVSTRLWLEDANALRRTLPAEAQAMLTRCEGAAPPPPEECAAADEAFNSRFLRRRPRPPAVEAYRAALPIPFNDRIYSHMWGRTEFVSTGTLKDYDGVPLLRRLDGRRTLFVTGEHDEARPRTVRRFARMAGGRFAVVPKASHSIWNDEPEAMAAILRPWLRRHDAA